MNKIKNLIWMTREALALAILNLAVRQFVVQHMPDFARDALSVVALATELVVLPAVAGWLVVARKRDRVWHALLGGLVVTVVSTLPALYGIVLAGFIRPNPWSVPLVPFLWLWFMLLYMIIGGPASLVGGVLAMRRQRRRAQIAESNV